jgi:hypothetical protein
MRTTVTIDDDLLAEVKIIAARTHRTVSSVLEDALRAALARAEASTAGTEPFELPTFRGSGLAPGVDLLNKAQLADLLGDNELPA